jgi:hypothetical protein
MSDLTQQIQAAQIRAGEEVVMANLDPALRTEETPNPNPIPEITARIKGYRQLSAEEQALINEAKDLAELCGEFVEKLRNVQPQIQPHHALDQRWVSIGATHLQEGFMAVIRGIAQPTTF